MESLPTEVWFSITEHFTHDEVQALIGVNRFFFNLGMDARYDDITIETSGKQVHLYLEHVMQNQVAKRIKHLTVQLQPVLPVRPIRALHSAPQPPSKREQFKQGFKTIVRKVLPERSPSPSFLPKPIETNEALVQKLIDVITCMKNVVDFRIVTWAFPEANCDLQPLHNAAWNTFGVNLKRVSLCANMEGHKSLIASNPRFNKLETLELEFSDTMNPFPVNNTSTASSDAAQIMTEAVVPFVNKLSPQIKTFKIRSWASLDLSNLFLGVDQFPVLEAILFRIPFNFALRSNPSGLTTFLHASSKTLKMVALRLTPVGLALDPLREEPLCQWMTETVSNPLCFSNAEILDICPTHLPGGMSILHSCVEHSTEHLSRFVLRDRYLTYEDVVPFVKTLRGARYLASLRLNVFRLNAPMFDAFARDLPMLQLLWLSVGDADSSAGSHQLSSLREDMKTRKYDTWNLWDLSIWQGGSELDGQTMLAIASSIPSLGSFWENGHKRIDC
ncbi:hypothetical protein DFP72DRAFT_812560 [Ephemerocybe angulata]|uniref:F-box domain-containing protein n=1 Tax=Ephemerocybe angulata TaxID=980116 RepID=A0A8H6HY21_9AGAR|nr:hypothetical protein DFP72DRAFT_812560 [Tulosesus angulatus]